MTIHVEDDAKMAYEYTEITSLVCTLKLERITCYPLTFQAANKLWSVI